MSRKDEFLEYKYRTPEERAEAAALPAIERQRRIQGMLIRYPLFKVIMAAVAGYHRPVKDGAPGTGKVAALLGESRAGKSWAIKNYAKDLGTITSETAIVPVCAYVDAIKGSTSLDFAMALWDVMRLGSTPRLNAPKILKHIVDEIEQTGVELVVIDDAQWLLLSSDKRTVKHVQGFLIDLAERNCCNIILAGEPSIADAVEATPHLIGRGLLPRTYVKTYDWQDAEGRKAFRFLLNAIDERLPFKEGSHLGDAFIAAHLYKLSGGLIGHVRTYVQEAAFLAMNDGADHVSVDHLRAAAEMHRAPGDRFVPFASPVDVDDPCGERRKEDERKVRDAVASLEKKPRGRPKKVVPPPVAP